MAESTDDQLKRCSVCQQGLPLTSFTRDRRAADGLDGRCRGCKSGKYAAWQNAQDADALRAKWRGYYDANRPARQEAGRSRYQAAPEVGRAAMRRRRVESPERLRQLERASYQRRTPVMREVRRLRKRAARLSDPDAFNAVRRAAYAASPERTREAVRRREAAKRAGVRLYGFTTEQIAAKVAYWGGLCWLCRAPFAEIDHVKPLARGGPHMLANLRPCCRSCNARKSDLWPLARVFAAFELVES